MVLKHCSTRGRGDENETFDCGRVARADRGRGPCMTETASALIQMTNERNIYGLRDGAGAQ